jgi:CRP/FNR family cyclic AMP-dependent transcriptional regulator
MLRCDRAVKGGESVVTHLPGRARPSGILDELDEAERRDVLSRMPRKRFAKGEVVFHEGDPGDVVHLIVKGHVSVRVTTPQGETAVLRVMGPDEMFGEYVLISPGPRSATVTALDQLETKCLGREDFHRLRADHPSLDALLLDGAIREIRRLSAALLDALYLPVTQRVLRRLLEIAVLYGADEGQAVPLSQTDLAGLAGVTRQTTNRVLAEVQTSGAIRLKRGSIEIRDVAALRARAR